MIDCDKLVKIVGFYKKEAYSEIGYYDKQAKLFYPVPFSLSNFKAVTCCEKCNKNGDKIILKGILDHGCNS